MLALLKVSQGHCFVTGDGKQEEGSLPLNSAAIRKTLVHTGMAVLLQSRQVYLVCDRTQLRSACGWSCSLAAAVVVMSPYLLSSSHSPEVQQVQKHLEPCITHSRLRAKVPLGLQLKEKEESRRGRKKRSRAAERKEWPENEGYFLFQRLEYNVKQGMVRKTVLQWNVLDCFLFWLFRSCPKGRRSALSQPSVLSRIISMSVAARKTIGLPTTLNTAPCAVCLVFGTMAKYLYLGIVSLLLCIWMQQQRQGTAENSFWPFKMFPGA